MQDDSVLKQLELIGQGKYHEALSVAELGRTIFFKHEKKFLNSFDLAELRNYLGNIILYYLKI